MSDLQQSFTVGESPRVEARFASGSLRVVPGESGVVEVTVSGGDLDRFAMEQRGDTILLSTQSGGWMSRRSYRVSVAVPSGTEVEAKLSSASVTTDAPLRTLRLTAASGDMRVREVQGNAEIKVASGDIDVGSVGGRLEISSASGDVDIESAGGDVKVNSASGDIVVRRVGGRAGFRTASGDVTIGSLDGGVLDAKSLSGDIRIGIPAGRTVYLDVQTTSGDVRNSFDFVDGGESSGRAEVRVKTVSGDVVLRPA